MGRAEGGDICDKSLLQTDTKRQPVCGHHLERCWAEAGMVGMSVSD